ncbi:hypothetical protein [Mycolicibacterium confluentis]|uniref:hypothetical protein n=1 Tax=Mycolicibacterium confluentis TaxID=28047 RepID=UPI000A16499D|nr:hypothetical protein [Mycolicibacterium confluentis]MCV7319034.1 hypothetical protein [Mycolicibacterium confluentis]ORV24768.1 hypothetical protein AWB99_04500 [Mycolicibacterium confluentis]
MTVWVIAGLLGMATGVRIGWALVNKQSLVSTAMIVALGSLAVVAALNWAPLTLLIDTWLRWPNVAVGISQIALIACAAGSCVMITSVASHRSPVTVRRIAFVQYSFAAAVAVVTATLFFAGGQQEEMAPAEYLTRNMGSSNLALPWLVPLLYVMFALTLVAWAGVRHSNSSRRGRALFVFTLGIVLILLAAAFFLIRAVSDAGLIGVGSAVVLLGCAMAVVGAGSLLPTVEDWFSGRRELSLIQPLLTELERRQPDIGIGVRPRGPMVFRVAERLSLISDALFLEATAALRRQVPDGDERPAENIDGYAATRGNWEVPDVTPVEQARAIAEWIHTGRHGGGHARFPGPVWLRQPESYSDREWIIEIARQYRNLSVV